MFLWKKRVPKKDQDLIQKLKFDIDHFHVFAHEGGVFYEKYGKGYVDFKWSAHIRSKQPEISEYVGIVNHKDFQLFQIEKIGVLVGKRKTNKGECYQVYILDCDNKKWTIDDYIGDPDLVDMESTTNSINIVIDIKDPKFLVSPKANARDYFQPTKQQRQDFENLLKQHRSKPQTKKRKMEQNDSNDEDDEYDEDDEEEEVDKF